MVLHCELPMKAEGHMHLRGHRQVLGVCRGAAASPEQTVQAGTGLSPLLCRVLGVKFVTFSGNTKNMKPVSLSGDSPEPGLVHQTAVLKKETVNVQKFYTLALVFTSRVC